MEGIEVQRWHGEPVAVWQDRWGVPTLRIFRRIGSTNDVARQLAADSAPAGSLVLADEQTRGRGQRGRSWSAPAGTSLSMSMVLRPGGPDESRLLTLRLGLAAAAAIEAVLPVRVALKWPNDLLVDARKVGGILCEATAAAGGATHIVAGIGLNLRRPKDGWPADIGARAAALEDAAGAPAAAPPLAGRIARAWLEAATMPGTSLSPEERAHFARRDALRGREITVEGRPAGIADGITAAGHLRVRDEEGTDNEIMAGTVRTREPIKEGPS